VAEHLGRNWPASLTSPHLDVAGHAHHPDLDGDLVTTQPVGVAAAVPALVGMAQRSLDRVGDPEA
jgi:hypothetical protein